MIKIGGIYRHFKGDYYLVEALANDSETKRKLVVYRQLYGDNELWVRDLEMFESLVDKNKYPNVQQEYRFELVEVKSVKE